MPRSNTMPIGRPPERQRRDIMAPKGQRQIDVLDLQAHEVGRPTFPSKRQRRGPPRGETKRDKFLRLGTARMQHAIYSIRLIGNLSRDDVYEYNANDIALIRATLLDAVAEAMGQFNHVRKDITFSFEKTS